MNFSVTYIKSTALHKLHTHSLTLIHFILVMLIFMIFTEMIWTTEFGVGLTGGCKCKKLITVLSFKRTKDCFFFRFIFSFTTRSNNVWNTFACIRNVWMYPAHVIWIKLPFYIPKMKEIKKNYKKKLLMFIRQLNQSENKVIWFETGFNSIAMILSEKKINSHKIVEMKLKLKSACITCIFCLFWYHFNVRCEPNRAKSRLTAKETKTCSFLKAPFQIAFRVLFRILFFFSLFI